MGSYRNLIGDPIKPEAVNQIKARAKLLGTTGYQDTSTILYKGRAHQAFIKLSSFVTLKDSALATAVNSGIGVDLAKKWTLFNGVRNGNGVEYNINDNANNIHLKGYGQGGTEELGIRPMPGIISATISPAGMAGSVRRAEIKFRCHNLAQLDIIDVLYLRFGFSMLLEWGHTMYTTNAGVVVIEPSPMDIFNTGKNWTKESVLKELAYRRRFTDGNYDGMLGLVTNYEWQMTPDGGYDCTLKLTGIGGVIESLKVNGTESQPSVSPFTYTPGSGPVAPPKTTGFTGGAASNFVSTALGTVNPAQKLSDAYSSTLTTAMSIIKEVVKSTTTMADFKGNLDRIFKPGLGLYSNPSAVHGYDHGFNAAYMADIEKKNVPAVDFNSVYSFAFWSFQGASADSIIPQNMDMVYIPLSMLLAIINNSCLAYNGTGNKSPFVYIDFHPETNFCFRLPDQFSLDPSVCLIDNADPGNKNYTAWLKNKGVDVNKMNPGIPSFDSTALQNALHTRLSNNKIPGYQDKVEARGKMMNILVNVDFVIQTLSQMASSDEKQSVYLSQFLSAIMGKIAKVTGNINNFQISYDDESNVVRIVDEQLVHTDDQRVYPTLPIFGLDSIVKAMSFKTEASSKIGSMLAIEAMAGERTPTTDGRDGSAFSALNSRIEDRLITERTRKSIDSTVTTNSDGITTRAGIFNSFKWQLYNDSKYNPAETENNINFYAECMNAMKAQITTENGITGTNPNSVTARGVLPLSINLTMAGISNIITREGFVIPPDRLPAQYKVGNKVRVGFVIADLTQTIQGQTWNTTIRGQMVNLPGNQVAQKSGTYIITKTTTPTAIGGKVAVIMGSPPASVSALGFGLPLAYPFSVGSFLFRQQSKTRGIAPTTGKDADHYGYDMSGPKRGTIDAALSAQVGGKGTTGDIIYSISDGTVRIARWSPKTFGNYVVIDTVAQGKNFTMVYGHMPPNGMSVKVGDVVKKGTPLGYVGNEGHSFGHHLHFEIWEGFRTPGVKGTAKLMDPGDMIPLFVADGGKAPGNSLSVGVRVQ